MAINFLVGSTDFDDYFDPYVSGSKTCPAGHYVGQQDIRDRYAPLSVGTKAADTGFLIGGVDVSNYFAGIGTASYWNGNFTPSSYPKSIIHYNADWNQVQAYSLLSIYPDGEVRVGSSLQIAYWAGSWNSGDSNTNGTNSEIIFQISNSSGNIVNGAPTWTLIGTAIKSLSVYAVGNGVTNGGIVSGTVTIRNSSDHSKTTSASFNLSAVNEPGDPV